MIGQSEGVETSPDGLQSVCSGAISDTKKGRHLTCNPAFAASFANHGSSTCVICRICRIWQVFMASESSNERMLAAYSDVI